MENPITFCISTFNNLNYLKLVIKSVRTYSHFKNAPFIIYSENSTDGTNDWLKENYLKYDLKVCMENNIVPKGIGGGMNFCAERVKTEWIMFLHADFFVSKDWDINALKATEKYGDKPIWVSSYRIQPNIFHEESRPGTLVVNSNEFGEFYNDFEEDYFIEFAEQFSTLNDVEVRKGEGVSGLIRKRDWDAVGGNDPLFAPASYEDMDLFVRMQLLDYIFLLTSKSVVWHFGSRGSHRLEENEGKTSERQSNSERANYVKWIKKWGQPPKFDENGFIMPIKGTNNPTKI